MTEFIYDITDEDFCFEITGEDYMDIQIEVQGADVSLFEPHALDSELDPTVIMPDPVDLCLKAINLGLLGYPPGMNRASAAELLESEYIQEKQLLRWVISAKHVPPGAILVLLNILQTRNLERIAIESLLPEETDADHMQWLELDSLEYPGCAEQLPFDLVLDPPANPSRDRMIEIEFMQEIDDALWEQCQEALSIWSKLLLLGGYPRENENPRGAYVYPDEAFQVDAFTVRQDILEIFLADEAAFNATINWAHHIHLTRAPVRIISIY